MSMNENFLKNIKCMLSEEDDEHVVEEPVKLACGTNACKKCLQNERNCLNCNNKHKETGQKELTEITDILKAHKDDLQTEVKYKLFKTLDEEKILDDEIQFYLQDTGIDIDIRIESLTIELDKHKGNLFDLADRIRRRIKRIRSSKLSLDSIKEILHQVSFVSSSNTITTSDVGKLETNYKGICTKTLNGHSDTVYCILEMKTGELASGSKDQTIKIWDVENGECKRTLNGHVNGVWRILETKRGELVSGSVDDTIKIWDIDTGECKKTLTGHSDWVYCILEMKTGKLVSGCTDNTIKVWM